MLAGRVHFLPDAVEPVELRGGAAIAIDVLRATTTICYALASGAREVRPCLEVDDARRLAESLGRGPCVLGGERGGVRIDGFDCGNSPAEFTSERVAGKTLVFTTTNGTRAIAACLSAERALLAAMCNVSAVCREVRRWPGPLDIVCAGTNGSPTREDVLAAGAIVDRLSSGPEQMWQWSDEALLARDAWRGVAFAADFPASVVAALRESRGGSNLVELGYHADIVAAARVDALDVVPMVLAEGDAVRIVVRPTPPSA
ncbi:MAG: 2-phosphosulfolactate phosphatase [Planctomycetota bacterium]|nr:MAG: 2-phosphosulfolactate phosphatase [Planctomycetota bacterium]